MAKYVHRTPVRDALGKAYSAAIGRYVQKLSALGYKAIMYAYGEGHSPNPPTYKEPVGDGKWRHRTGNLHDSFASAVYVNGALIEDSIRYIGPQIAWERTDYEYAVGRSHAWWYLHNPPVDVSGEITLLCLAAMYYAEYLEDGTHRGGYHIQVISAASDYIQEHWHEVEDEVFGIAKVRYIAGESER